MPVRAKPKKQLLVHMPLDKAQWLRKRSEQTGESMTHHVVAALDAEMKRQARIERRAQREATAR